MIILGVDPGSRAAGFGVLEIEGKQEVLLTCGTLRFDGSDSHQLRLKQIYERVEALIREHRPDEVAVEMPVYGKNPQSMLKLGRAQAAAMLAALNREIPVTEYTPKEVKKSVTGNGNASKQQVQFMVRSMLEVAKSEEMSLDASDALAVALCHAHRATEGQAERHKGWGSFVEANPDRVA